MKANPIGRHCRICRKPGGVGATEALRTAGFLVIRGSEKWHPYAHHNCIAKIRTKQYMKKGAR